MIVNTSLKDIEAVLGLYKMASDFKKTVSGVQWPEFDQRMIETEINESRHFKITIDEKVVCVWSITFDDHQVWEEKNEDPAIYIHRIATNPNFRGQKFVEQIVEWAKQFAPQHNKLYLRMDTTAGNQRLTDYYVKCGFTYLGDKKMTDTEGRPDHYHNATMALFQLDV
ncbi:Acetyltransferase (GNAT) family [Chryseobacterium nakagawai]|uniref:GNAT family N-acetyltransferase n=1 Tax=Chryseobacterium nakagawai TaxID=1241982 RepID=A0AAD0YI60_CHRNA|nr:GNAT family N-acetyltransferase [Chryseobacterium nakagawai]AZA89459.1 GNAT family N-acetyltransferase [Chryseobacterium nakagawai]VEH20824.1 Acetyltransferase (GNAT) family [Chryseobacterium nakagawai]